jgi:hypothetical protein
VKYQRHKAKGRALLIVVIVFIAGIGRANAAAIDDIQIVVINDVCDGSDPNPKSFVVYAHNKNGARPISATFQYDSNPSSQSFSLFDASLAPYTDRFPKSLVIRVAAGATTPIGCTINYRPSPVPLVFTKVPIVITLTGAAYVNPNQPNRPLEDARAFSAFLLQERSACPSGGKPTGKFYYLNLHPYARLTATITLLGSSTPQIGLDLAPVSLAPVGCSNGNGSPSGIATVNLVYPPDQKQLSK